MQPSAKVARQTIASVFERFNDENDLKGDFPWSKEWVACVLFFLSKKKVQN